MSKIDRDWVRAAAHRFNIELTEQEINEFVEGFSMIAFTESELEADKRAERRAILGLRALVGVWVAALVAALTLYVWSVQ